MQISLFILCKISKRCKLVTCNFLEFVKLLRNFVILCNLGHVKIWASQLQQKGHKKKYNSEDSRNFQIGKSS